MENKNITPEPVPYIVFEAAQARSERIIRRLIVAVVVSSALLVASNALWLALVLH